MRGSRCEESLSVVFCWLGTFKKLNLKATKKRKEKKIVPRTEPRKNIQNKRR